MERSAAPPSDLQEDLARDYWIHVGRDRTAAAVKTMVLMALVLQFIFSFLDYFAYPQRFMFFFSLRMSVNVVMLWILFHGRIRYARLSMSVLSLALGLEILAMVHATYAPTSDYYAGLMILFAATPVLIPLNGREAAGISGVLCGVYAVSALTSPGPIPWKPFIIHQIVLSSVGLACALSCGFLERVRLKEFMQRREIEHARDRLAHLDEAKSRFTSNVHHELRTPLTLMLSPMEGMLTNEFGPVPDQLLSYLRTMHANGLRLLKLINNLLDLAKIESDRLTICRRRLDLGQLIEEIASAALPMAERKGISLQTAAASQIIFGDRDALEKVVVNLLSNALKFTDSGGFILLRLEQVREGVQISVQDNGAGIPPEQLERVFDRFAQVDGSATRKFEGTGIGLSLTLELVRLHQGRVWAESEGLGHGTVFHVVLPIGEADKETEESLLEEESARDTGKLRRSFESLAAEADLEARTSARDGQVVADGDSQAVALNADESDPRSEVLVVDDNADMRRLLVDLLSREFRVFTARNGREGLELFRARMPTMVLTDVMMPEMTGIELCHAIKQDPETRNVPVILVTSKAEREMKIQGLELGADDYVTKPFHPRELMARVRAFARLRDIENTLKQRNEALEKTISQLRWTQAQLVHRGKMESLGSLVAGIAHELNNPLNFIVGNLYYVDEYLGTLMKIVDQMRLASSELDADVAAKFEGFCVESSFEHIKLDIGGILQGLREGASRATQLVTELRVFSRIDSPDVVEVDLNQSLDSTLRLLSHRVKRIDLVREYSDLPTLRCIGGQINQVFMNLLVNALDAMDDAGRLCVRTSRLGDDRIRVEIEDSGSGIPPEIIERIFDPFFTTKPVGKGTGLGLALSYGIIARHGGTIQVESQPGRGSTFRVELLAQQDDGRLLENAHQDIAVPGEKS